MTAGVAYWGGLKGDQKGYKGWRKGQKGGKGKGKTGSPSGGFQGYCHHCGEWGHSISRCKLKDEEMNKKRSGGSHADSFESTPLLREDSSGMKSLEALEKCGGWRTLCMVNKFEPLMKLCDDEHEEDWDLHHDDPKESPDTWTVVKRKSKSGRKSKAEASRRNG